MHQHPPSPEKPALPSTARPLNTPKKCTPQDPNKQTPATSKASNLQRELNSDFEKLRTVSKTISTIYDESASSIDEDEEYASFEQLKSFEFAEISRLEEEFQRQNEATSLKSFLPWAFHLKT